MEIISAASPPGEMEAWAGAGHGWQQEWEAGWEQKTAHRLGLRTTFKVVLSNFWTRVGYFGVISHSTNIH